MKKILCLSLLFYGIVNAQIVNIPDVNFKAKLLEASPLNSIAFDADNNNIAIDTNEDGEIQLSEALAVYRLYVIGIQDFPDLQIDDLTGIEAFTNLTVLNCSTNNLTILEISDLINLEVLICGLNELTSLNVSNQINLNYLQCSYNSLTALDVSNLENLSYLLCNDNQINELDCSNNFYLERLHFGGNALTYLNLKNGSDLDPDMWTDIDFSDAFNGFADYTNICVDDFEMEQIESQLGDWFEWHVSSTCTFYPAGDYNTITGSLLFDVNNDGSCDENDSPQPFIKININDGIGENSAFANTLGNYIFYTREGTFSLTPQIENPAFFNITPEDTTINFPVVDNGTETRNFCITPNGIHPDVEVVIAPLIPARPGFQATYKIVYRNKGNQIVSGSIDFQFDDERLDFTSSNPSPDTQSTGSLTYSFTDLLPFENREITLNLNVNAPPVNIGDILPFTVEISSNPADEIPEDNTFVFNQTVVDTYDPNNITCIEGDVVDPVMIGEELHYLIRFENTGNHVAERVVITMELDPAQYDVSSLRVLNSSHSVEARVVGNTAEFFFEAIYLDTGGHGNILLLVNSNDDLNEGDKVLSNADIYFNYNYPVTTNEAETTFEILGTEDVGLNAEVSIYPNPVKDNVTIKSESKIKSIELYDQSGKLLKVSFINQPETNQNLSYLYPGVYFLKIYTMQGTITHKVIKQ